MADFQSRQFKKLQSKWYGILKETGFQDIEDASGNLTDHQSVQDFAQRIGFRAGLVEEIQDYFSWACEMVWRGRFKSAQDRMIWRLHAEGKSSRKIQEKTGLDRRWISRKILKLRHELQLQSPKKEAA